MTTRPGRRVSGIRAGRRRNRATRLRELLNDPYRPVAAWEARAAVPRGSARPRTPDEAVAALRTDPRLLELRADFAGHVRAWLAEHARAAQWHDDLTRGSVRCLTRPSRARICAATGMSISSYQRCRRVLESWGYVGTVRRGWTPHLRAASLADPGQPNLAACYVLAVPRARPGPPTDRTEPGHALRRHRQPPAAAAHSPLTDPLTGSPSGFLGDPERQEQSQAREQPTPGRSGRLAASSASPAAHFPAHGAVLRAAARHKLSNRGASRLAAPFAAAGWSPAMLGYAVSTRPDGSNHPHRAQTVRLPFGWLAYRLGFWLAADGRPVDFPAAAAAELDRRRAEHATRHVRKSQTNNPAPADPAPHAAAIRAALGWKETPR